MNKPPCYEAVRLVLFLPEGNIHTHTVRAVYISTTSYQVVLRQRLALFES